MFNTEIVNKLEEEFGPERVKDFSEMASYMFNLKYAKCDTLECLNEFDYERDWWLNKFNELNNK